MVDDDRRGGEKMSERCVGSFFFVLLHGHVRADGSGISFSFLSVRAPAFRSTL